MRRVGKREKILQSKILKMIIPVRYMLKTYLHCGDLKSCTHTYHYYYTGTTFQIAALYFQ